jgi:hypothetical protein
MSLKSPKFGAVAVGDVVRVVAWLPENSAAGAFTRHRATVTRVTAREFEVSAPAGVRFTKTYGLQVGADLSGKKTFHEVTENLGPQRGAADGGPKEAA